jgi:hypothetical protein
MRLLFQLQASALKIPGPGFLTSKLTDSDKTMQSCHLSPGNTPIAVDSSACVFYDSGPCWLASVS